MTLSGQSRSYPAPRGEAARPHDLVTANGQIWYCYQLANVLGRSLLHSIALRCTVWFLNASLPSVTCSPSLTTSLTRCARVDSRYQLMDQFSFSRFFSSDVERLFRFRSVFFVTLTVSSLHCSTQSPLLLAIPTSTASPRALLLFLLLATTTACAICWLSHHSPVPLPSTTCPALVLCGRRGPLDLSGLAPRVRYVALRGPSRVNVFSLTKRLASNTILENFDPHKRMERSCHGRWGCFVTSCSLVRSDYTGTTGGFNYGLNVVR